MAHRIACVSRLNRTTIEPSTEEPGEQEQDRSDPDNTHALALSNLIGLNIDDDEAPYQNVGDVAYWAWLPSF